MFNLFWLFTFKRNNEGKLWKAKLFSQWEGTNEQYIVANKVNEANCLW